MQEILVSPEVAKLAKKYFDWKCDSVLDEDGPRLLQYYEGDCLGAIKNSDLL